MHAAFLRGINLGGRSLLMADLRTCVESLGCTSVKTILQSGTVVFALGKQRAASFEQTLESALLREFGLTTTVALRSADDIRKILENNPFDEMAQSDPSHLVVVVLKTAVNAAAVRALEKAVVGRELVAAGEGVVYLTYPDGIGESKLTPAVIDRALGTVGTARNWNTMQRIAAALGAG